MARLARLHIPDQPQYVILRALGGLPAFIDEHDYALFLDCLKTEAKARRLSVHAWSLMPSAAHLLVTPTDEDSLPRTMQALGRRYVALFNRRHDRHGTAWEGRYRSTVFEAEPYLLTAMRVIELAPVGSGLAAAPEDYQWSSYRHHAGIETNTLITNHPLYWALGNTPLDRQRAYRDLAAQPVDAAEQTQLLEAAHKGWVLGSASWREWAAQHANRRVAPLKRGRPRKVKVVPAQPAAQP